MGVGRQKDLRVRVDDEHLLPQGRIARVKGKEGTTGLEDTEDGQDLRDPMFGTDSDNAVRTDSLLPQHMSKTVGLGVELCVGEVLVLVFDSNHGGSLRSLSLDELMQLALDWVDGSRSRQFLNETCDLIVADISNLRVWVISEGINETDIDVQEPASTLPVVQVVA